MSFGPLESALKRALEAPKNIPVSSLAGMLCCDDAGFWEEVRSASYSLKLKHIGPAVSFRGLVECSNVCAKDCFYCGIRKSNKNVCRYSLRESEIIESALLAKELGYGSVALQSGEIESEANTAKFEEVLKAISQYLGVTLSLGEQTEKVFQRWRDAGAKRYLLRIETSDRELYSRIHPNSCDFLRRKNCLRILRDLDYQVGTGVMIGLPGQSFDMLARDIAFFGETDVDMIGMGPYIPHPDTPLKGAWDSEKAYKLGLKMIALTRLYLHDVNIAATTALQALSPRGREEGLLYGANVMMPNITPLKYRESYKLYADKPQTDENSAESREALSEAIRSIGERINYHSEGNSPHYLARHG